MRTIKTMQFAIIVGQSALIAAQVTVYVLFASYYLDEVWKYEAGIVPRPAGLSVVRILGAFVLPVCHITAAAIGAIGYRRGSRRKVDLVVLIGQLFLLFVGIILFFALGALFIAAHA